MLVSPLHQDCYADGDLYGSGSTSGTLAKTTSYCARLPRLARSCKYPSVLYPTQSASVSPLHQDCYAAAILTTLPFADLLLLENEHRVLPKLEHVVEQGLQSRYHSQVMDDL